MPKIYIYGLVHPWDVLEERNVRYVGKTKHLGRRLKEHMTICRKPAYNKRFYNWLLDIREMGDKPKILILEEADEKLWEEKEKFWIRRLGQNILNIAEGGNGTQTPWNKGRKGMKPWNKGIKLSEEHKKRLSLAHKGFVVPGERRKKISEKLRGKKKTEKHRMAISAGMVGKEFSKEHLVNLRLSHLGHYPSQETRDRMKESQRRRWAERKLKILISN